MSCSNTRPGSVRIPVSTKRSTVRSRAGGRGRGSSVQWVGLGVTAILPDAWRVWGRKIDSPESLGDMNGLADLRDAMSERGTVDLLVTVQSWVRLKLGWLLTIDMMQISMVIHHVVALMWVYFLKLGRHGERVLLFSSLAKIYSFLTSWKKQEANIYCNNRCNLKIIKK